MYSDRSGSVGLSACFLITLKLLSAERYWRNPLSVVRILGMFVRHWKRALVVVAILVFIYFMPYGYFMSFLTSVPGVNTIVCESIPGHLCGAGGEWVSVTLTRWILVGSVAVDSPLALYFPFLDFLWVLIGVFFVFSVSWLGLVNRRWMRTCANCQNELLTGSR